MGGGLYSVISHNHCSEQLWLLIHACFQVFVLEHQLLLFSSGGSLPDEPHLHSPINSPVQSRAEAAGLDALPPKLGSEISLGKIYGII